MDNPDVARVSDGLSSGVRGHCSNGVSSGSLSNQGSYTGHTQGPTVFDAQVESELRTFVNHVCIITDVETAAVYGNLQPVVHNSSDTNAMALRMALRLRACSLHVIASHKASKQHRDGHMSQTASFLLSRRAPRTSMS
jgi:hypothetical protein